MRFRLRTLLLLTTVVAAVTAWSRWPERTAEQFFEAVRIGNSDRVREMVAHGGPLPPMIEQRLKAAARAKQCAAMLRPYVGRADILRLEATQTTVSDYIRGRRRYVLHDYSPPCEFETQYGRIQSLEQPSHFISGGDAIFVY